MVSVDVKHHVYLALGYCPSIINLMVSEDVKHHERSRSPGFSTEGTDLNFCVRSTLPQVLKDKRRLLLQNQQELDITFSAESILNK